MGKIGDAEVEARIIHQDNDIGLIIKDIFLALGDISQHLAQVDRHLHEAHVSHRAVMFEQLDTFGLHQVTATATKLRPLVLLLEFSDKIGSVQIA